MSEQSDNAVPTNATDDQTNATDDQQSPLDRAAAAGPLPGIGGSDDDRAADNAEPAVAHDSPAGVEEQRAADPDADGDELAGPDRLTSIYGPPPGDRE